MRLRSPDLFPLACAGWTLATNAQDFESSIDLTYLQRIYAAMQESPTELSLPRYSALRSAYQCVSDLDSLAEKFLSLCAAAKRGLWLREADLTGTGPGPGLGPIDHNLSTDIFQIASALKGNIITG